MTDNSNPITVEEDIKQIIVQYLIDNVYAKTFSDEFDPDTLIDKAIQNSKGIINVNYSNLRGNYSQESEVSSRYALTQPFDINIFMKDYKDMSYYLDQCRKYLCGWYENNSDGVLVSREGLRYKNTSFDPISTFLSPFSWINKTKNSCWVAVLAVKISIPFPFTY